MLTTQVAPDPPRFCASPMECRVNCRSPASQRICCTTSQICATPVAPTGCPLDFNPPLAFTGFSPPRRVQPAEANRPPSPRSQNPKSSVAITSAMVALTPAAVCGGAGGFSQVSITYEFTTVTPQLLTPLVNGLSVPASACFPNSS